MPFTEDCEDIFVELTEDVFSVGCVLMEEEGRPRELEKRDPVGERAEGWRNCGLLADPALGGDMGPRDTAGFRELFSGLTTLSSSSSSRRRDEGEGEGGGVGIPIPR